MRCQAGDIAVIVASGFDGNIGGLVKVLRPSEDSTFELPEWECESLGRLMSFEYLDEFFLCEMPVVPGDLIDIEDSDLRPLRGLGDDEPVEMVERVGKPCEVTA